MTNKNQTPSLSDLSPQDHLFRSISPKDIDYAISLGANLDEWRDNIYPPYYIMHVAILGQASILQYIIKLGVNVNVECSNGRNALDYTNDFHCAKLLVNAGCLKNPTERNNFKLTNMIGFIDKKKELKKDKDEKKREVVELMISKGASSDDFNDIIGNIEDENTLDYIIEHGGEISFKTLNKSTSLNNIKLQIQKGGNIHSPSDNNNMMTLLNIQENIEIVEFLLQQKLDPNIQNIFGECALHYASCTQNCKKIDMLIKYGANIDWLDNKGRSAIFYAEGLSTFENFINKGAKVDILDVRGEGLIDKLNQSIYMDESDKIKMRELVLSRISQNSKKEISLELKNIINHKSSNKKSPKI